MTCDLGMLRQVELTCQVSERRGRWKVTGESPLDGHNQERRLLVWVRASRKAAGGGQVEASLGEAFAVRQQRQD